VWKVTKCPFPAATSATGKARLSSTGTWFEALYDKTIGGPRARAVCHLISDRACIIETSNFSDSSSSPGCRCQSRSQFRRPTGQPTGLSRNYGIRGGGGLRCALTGESYNIWELQQKRRLRQGATPLEPVGLCRQLRHAADRRPRCPLHNFDRRRRRRRRRRRLASRRRKYATAVSVARATGGGVATSLRKMISSLSAEWMYRQDEARSARTQQLKPQDRRMTTTFWKSLFITSCCSAIQQK